MAGGKRYARPALDQAVELKAWRMVFGSGYDFLKALPRIGVEISNRHQPERTVAQEAWHRLGVAYLAEDRSRPMPPWALREFGEPGQTPAAPPRGRRR